MLSFWTNFVSDDLPVRRPAGRVLIRNCKIRNADRLLHLNLSGNESWQKGLPPTDITFENVKAEGIKMGLTAYGIEGSPMMIKLSDVEYSFREGSEQSPMFRVAHCGIELERVKVKGFAGDNLIRAWSDDVSVNADTLECELGEAKLLARADEEFVCTPI